MKRDRRVLLVEICALLCCGVMCVVVVLGAELTITGTVTKEGIVSDDGKMYAVSEDQRGNELLKLVDRKVEVRGTVEEGEGEKIITVIQFVVIE